MKGADRQQAIAIVAVDPVRRDTLDRAFTLAGFKTAAVASTKELTTGDRAGPVAFVLDGFGPDDERREVARLRENWPTVAVWAITETTKFLGGETSGPAALRVPCDGVLANVLRELIPKGTASVNEKILRAKQEYERIFDSTPDPIFVVSDALTITRANAAFFKKVGKPPGEVVGTHCVELLHGILEPWGNHLLAKVLQNPRPLRWRMPDSALGQPYESTSFSVTMPDATVDVAHQLREVPEAESAADAGAAERLSLLGKMAAGMVHELNNPLGAVLGFAEILEDSGACPQEFKDDLKQIQHEAWRCRRIVNNLLLLARSPEPVRTATDVNELIERAIAVRGYQRAGGSIEIATACAPDLPLAMVDPDQIEQVVLNLLTNAQEALAGQTAAERARRAPAVLVSTRVENGDLIISVADNGPGIDPNVLDLIFDPLFSTKGAGKGTGLGLSVSRMLIRQHGGDVTVQNREGGGALFTVRLPLVVAAKTASALAKATAPVGRILIVDNESIVRDFLARLLRVNGHQAVTCGTLEDVARVLASEDFDVVIAELSMLDAVGGAILDRLNRRYPDLSHRLILMTSGVGPPTGPASRSSQSPILQKPFTPEQLRRSVRAVLATRTS